jgi:hypothetical protein
MPGHDGSANFINPTFNMKWAVGVDTPAISYTLAEDEALNLGKYLWRVRTQDFGCGT